MSINFLNFSFFCCLSLENLYALAFSFLKYSWWTMGWVDSFSESYGFEFEFLAELFGVVEEKGSIVIRSFRAYST